MKKYAYLILFIIFIQTGCVSLKKNESPCTLTGEMTENVSGNGWSYYLNFTNNSSKTVKKAGFVLSVYNEDGEPAFENDWIEFYVERIVEEGETIDFSYSLDECFEEMPEYAYMTDYFYATRIEYTDGSVFEDPFGRFAE